MAARRTLAGLLAVPALALPAVLAGCGDDSSIADPPVASPPHSVATSDPPARESAEHFIRRWAAEDTRIQQTGDTASFRAMSVGCRGCTKLADLVDRIYKSGGFIHTRGWQVRRISKAGPSTYTLQVFAAPTTYTSSAGGEVKHLASGPATFQLRLQGPAPEWHVVELVQVG